MFKFKDFRITENEDGIEFIMAAKESGRLYLSIVFNDELSIYNSYVKFKTKDEYEKVKLMSESDRKELEEILKEKTELFIKNEITAVMDDDLTLGFDYGHYNQRTCEEDYHIFKSMFGKQMEFDDDLLKRFDKLFPNPQIIDLEIVDKDLKDFAECCEIILKS